MPWAFLFRKNDYIQNKNKLYSIYNSGIKFLNQIYSETFGTFNEWGVNALVTQESFVYLERSQSTPGAGGGGVGCTILDNIDFLAIYYSHISIKKSI